MPSMQLQHVSFTFVEHQLFHDVSLHLRDGWTGVVGGNGAGKSTLLELMAGVRRPEVGAVVFEPKETRVALCAQRVERCAPEVHAFAEESSREAHRWRSQLGLTPEEVERWDTLSPGERKRWQVGAALASEPEVLLLDEPLNHLDGAAKELLLAALKRFRGVGVIVAHDRAFLDALTTSTVRVLNGACELRPGGYSAARSQWERDESTARTARALVKQRLEHQRRRDDEERRRVEASQRSRSASHRMRNKHDSDARSLGADFRAEMAEKSHAGRLRRSQEATARLEERLEALEVRYEAARALFVRDEPCPRPVVVTLAGDVCVGERTLLRDVRLQVARGEHIVLSGPNGAGKTTLLARLLERCTLPRERVLVLPQELTLDEQREDLEVLHSLTREERGRVLQLVDALGLDPEQLLRTELASPGEARKLRLALGLGRVAWLAVLDEPTNHLDLPSVEKLERALHEFPGALLVVSHDAALATSLGRVTWRLEGGRVQ